MPKEPEEGNELTSDTQTAVKPDISDTSSTGAVSVAAEGSKPGSVEQPVVDEREVKRLQALLKEQQSIQAGLTRAQKRAEDQANAAAAKVKELEDRLGNYQAATAGNEGTLSEIQAELDAQRAEADKFRDNLAAALQENERFKVLLSEYTQGPIAALVAADALPRATDLDEFRQSMNKVVEAVQDTTQQGVFFKMHGDRPTASPPAGTGGQTVDTLNKQMNEAMAAGDWEKYNKLSSQRYDLLDAEGLLEQTNRQF